MDMKRTSKVDQGRRTMTRPESCSGDVLRRQRDDHFSGAKDSRIIDRGLSKKENRGNHSLDGRNRNFTANLTRIQESTSNSSSINRASFSNRIIKKETSKRLREENHMESDRPNKYHKVSEKSAVSLGGESGVRVSTDKRKPISVVSKAPFKNNRIIPKKRAEDLQDGGDYFCRRKYSRTSLNKIFHPKVEVSKPPVSDSSTRREESEAASKGLRTSVIASGEEKESFRLASQRNNQVSNITGRKHEEQEERREDFPCSSRSQISANLMSDGIVDKSQVKVTSIMDRRAAKSLNEKDNLRLDHRNKDQKLNERRLVPPAKDHFQKPAEKMFSTIKKPSINYQVIPSRRNLPMVIEKRTTTRARQNLLRKFSDTVAPKKPQAATPKRQGRVVNLILNKYEEFKKSYYGNNDSSIVKPKGECKPAKIGLPKGSANDMDDHQTSKEVSWLPDISSPEDGEEERNSLVSNNNARKESDMLYDWNALIAKSGCATTGSDSCQRRRNVPTEGKPSIAERTRDYSSEFRHILAKQEINTKRHSESDQEHNGNEGENSERRHHLKKDSRTKETHQTSDKSITSMEKRNNADQKLGMNDNTLREHKGIAVQQLEGLNLSWLPEILSSEDEEEEKHCLDLLKQAPSTIEEAKSSFQKENRTDGKETTNQPIALETKVDPPKPKEDTKPESSWRTRQQPNNKLAKTIQPSTEKSTSVPKAAAPKKDRPWWRSLFYSDDESSEGEDYNIGPQKNDAKKKTDMQSDWEGLVGTKARPTKSSGRQEKSGFREESRRSSKGQSRKSSRRDKSKHDKRREVSSKLRHKPQNGFR